MLVREAPAWTNMWLLQRSGCTRPFRHLRGLAGIAVPLSPVGSRRRSWLALAVLAALLFFGESREEGGEVGLGVDKGGTCWVLRGRGGKRNNTQTG